MCIGDYTRLWFFSCICPAKIKISLFYFYKLFKRNLMGMFLGVQHFTSASVSQQVAHNKIQQNKIKNSFLSKTKSNKQKKKHKLFCAALIARC